VARLARTRNQIVAPEQLAGLSVMAIDIAAERRHLAIGAGQHDAVHDNRAGGVGGVIIAAAVDLPQFLAGPGVERDQEVVASGAVDLVVIEENAALAPAPAII